MTMFYVASTSAPVAPSAPPSQNGSAPAKAPAKAAAPAPQAASPSGTSVAELKGTTVPFNAMQSAVSKNMLESLKVLLLLKIKLCYLSSGFYHDSLADQLFHIELLRKGDYFNIL